MTIFEFICSLRYLLFSSYRRHLRGLRERTTLRFYYYTPILFPPGDTSLSPADFDDTVNRCNIDNNVFVDLEHCPIIVRLMESIKSHKATLSFPTMQILSEIYAEKFISYLHNRLMCRDLASIQL